MRLDAEAVAVIDRPWPRANAIPAAFDELFRAEYARVVRIAYRVVGDQGAAEDVAQDVSSPTTGRIRPTRPMRRRGSTGPPRTRR